MKNLAAKFSDAYFYAEPMPNGGHKFTPVPEPEVREVHEKMRYQQVDIYIANCAEPSGQIVDGRVYDISSGLMLTPEA